MRGILLGALTVCISFSLFAQSKEEKAARKHAEAIQKSKDKGSIIVDQDTIYNAGTAYGVLKNEGTMMMQKFRAYSLSGKEAFFVDGTVVKNNWHFIFKSIGRELDLLMLEGNNAAAPISETIVKNDLIGADGLNVEKARYFLMKYGPHKTGTKLGTEITQVKRDKKEMVLAYSNQILQGGKQIGSYETKSENTKEYGNRRVCYIYFMDGAICAKAILGAGDANKASVTTNSDGKTEMVSDAVLEVDDIAKYLADNSYL